jgi:hypothetical protein
MLRDIVAARCSNGSECGPNKNLSVTIQYFRYLLSPSVVSTTDYIHTSRRSRCGDNGLVTDSGVSQNFLKTVTIFTPHGDQSVEIAVLLRMVAFRKTSLKQFSGCGEQNSRSSFGSRDKAC